MAKEGENGYRDGFHFQVPTNRTKWESFQNAIYDPSSNQFCGRTPKSWGQLLFFYTIFYIVLAALFAISMQGLLATIHEREPKWQLDSSLIGSNPGLGFRPISNITEEGALIWYNQKNHTTGDKWVALIDEFLEPYMNNQTGRNFVGCNYQKKPNESSVCLVNMDKFGACRHNDSYGYRSPSPCVFLKLNRIYGWQPEFYTTPTKDMPQDLNITITTENEMEKKQIWISCDGAGPSDKENLRGFEYLPRGFPEYYYPFTNTPNYLSPLIAVKVLNPVPNVIISIECRAWAKNIAYSGGNLRREGSVQFQIMNDSM